MQRTLVLAKPDAVQRGLIGEIIGRFERKGLKVVGLRLLTVPREMAERHYAVHAGKHFYDGLVEFITSGPVAAIALEGPDAIAVVRLMVGKTMPNEAEPGNDPRRPRGQRAPQPDPCLGRAGDRGGGAGALVRGRCARRLSARGRCLDRRRGAGPSLRLVVAGGRAADTRAAR